MKRLTYREAGELYDLEIRDIRQEHQEALHQIWKTSIRHREDAERHLFNRYERAFYRLKERRQPTIIKTKWGMLFG